MYINNKDLVIFLVGKYIQKEGSLKYDDEITFY